MAESRLHELSDAGQSVWIDNLSRDARPPGELKRLMQEDAVVGVTSNPTIFQKAIAQGDAYDEQLQELLAARLDDPKEMFLRLAPQDVARRVRPAAPGLGRDGGARRLRLDRGRPDARLRHRGDVRRRRCGSTTRSTGRTCYVKIPATTAGPAGDRGHDRARQVDQRDADLLAAALQGGRRGVHPRARAARRGRRRPVEGRVGRELLRLARRHRGRQAARRGSAARAEGQARDREREARLPALPRGVLRAALGVPRRQGRDEAALPLGVDVDEEPRRTAT